MDLLPFIISKFCSLAFHCTQCEQNSKMPPFPLNEDRVAGRLRSEIGCTGGEGGAELRLPTDFPLGEPGPLLATPL